MTEWSAGRAVVELLKPEQVPHVRSRKPAIVV